MKKATWIMLLSALTLTLVCSGLALAQTPAPAAAAPAAAKIDSGDTAWVLVSAALVLLMTAPGLALFYGGMVRQKNALGTLMQSFIAIAVISVCCTRATSSAMRRSPSGVRNRP